MKGKLKTYWMEVSAGNKLPTSGRGRERETPNHSQQQHQQLEKHHSAHS